jgi:hypothetical protein
VQSVDHDNHKQNRAKRWPCTKQKKRGGKNKTKPKGGHAQNRASHTSPVWVVVWPHAPRRRCRMSGPRGEVAPPRLVSRPVAWRPPAVVTRSSPSGHPPSGPLPFGPQPTKMEALAHHGLARCGPKLPVVPTLVPNFPLRGLLLLGLPLLGSGDHPALQRAVAGDERLCHPGSPGGTGGHPYPTVSQKPGPATVRGLISIHNLGPGWSRLESGVVGMSFD